MRSLTLAEATARQAELLGRFTILHPTPWNRAVAMVAPLPLAARS